MSTLREDCRERGWKIAENFGNANNPPVLRPFSPTFHLIKPALIFSKRWRLSRKKRSKLAAPKRRQIALWPRHGTNGTCIYTRVDVDLWRVSVIDYEATFLVLIEWFTRLLYVITCKINVLIWQTTWVEKITTNGCCNSVKVRWLNDATCVHIIIFQFFSAFQIFIIMRKYY